MQGTNPLKYLSSLSKREMPSLQAGQIAKNKDENSQSENTSNNNSVENLTVYKTDMGTTSGSIANVEDCTAAASGIEDNRLTDTANAGNTILVNKVHNTAIIDSNNTFGDSRTDLANDMTSLQLSQENKSRLSHTPGKPLNDNLPEPSGPTNLYLLSMPAEVQNEILSYLVPRGVLIEPCSPIVPRYEQDQFGTNIRSSNRHPNLHLRSLFTTRLSDLEYHTIPDEILVPFSPFPTETLRIYQVSGIGMSHALDEEKSQEYPLSVFAICQKYRSMALSLLYSFNEILFRDGLSIERFYRNLQPLIANQLRNIRVDLKMSLLAYRGKKDESMVPLELALIGTTALQSCRSVETLIFTLHLDFCNLQHRIGQFLNAYEDKSSTKLLTQATIIVTTVSCLQCNNLEYQRTVPGQPENEPYQKSEPNQFWEWKRGPNEETFQTKRYIVRADSRTELVSLRDIIRKFRDDAKENRPAALSKLLENGQRLQQKKCANVPACQNTCEGIPADLLRSRPYWCSKCELVFHCHQCRSFFEEHKLLCVQKPETHYA